MPSSNNSHHHKTTLSLGVAYKVWVTYATTAGAGFYSEWLEISLTKDMVAKVKAPPKVKI
ncbi:MAG: hypothetical protein GC192_19485 [Bacteroidetes bacterium]|nr:hypothetical protein [Bacteroidota bacterium]